MLMFSHSNQSINFSFMDLKDLNESFALSSIHMGIHNTAFLIQQ